MEIYEDVMPEHRVLMDLAVQTESTTARLLQAWAIYQSVYAFTGSRLRSDTPCLELSTKGCGVLNG